MELRVTVDAGKVTGALERGAARAGASGARLVRHFGMLLQTQVKANAQGRPGPRMQTGDYSRSISLRVEGDGRMGVMAASVGTNRPQGPRLEFGFVGADSLGRTYAQAPLPHFGPAIDRIGPRFEAAVADLAERAVEGP